jgi:hypothetical protein
MSHIYNTNCYHRTAENPANDSDTAAHPTIQEDVFFAEGDFCTAEIIYTYPNNNVK